MRRLLTVCIVMLSFHASVWAEGTKQLRPQENNNGSLHIRPGDNNYTRFGEYDAPSENQIKIRISDTSEVIYFGLNNQIENGGNNWVGRFADDVEYRILDPSGNVVYESVIPDVGNEGNIPDWDAAVAGPQEIFGAGGYDAIELAVSDTGDYVIEFNPGDFPNGNQMYINLHLIDITVADSLNRPQDGRLHSQGWQINTHAFSNPFFGTVYPYHPDGIIYEVDFNQIQPYLFVINFNSTGTDSTGNFFADRRTRRFNSTYPEFDVFLNPPDTNIYPVFLREVTFNANITNTNCDSTEICLSFSTNAPGEVEGFIDFNGNGVYDEDTGELYFGDLTDGANETCITWDGKDADGNVIDQRQMQMISSFGYGVMHLPLYDAEHNRNGFRVKVYEPKSLGDPALYWDDSQINSGNTLGDSRINIIGCTNPSGCHRWENRGDINGNNSNSETINTWWYSQVQYDTLVFQNIWNRPISLSFDPDSLDQQEKSICEGDSISFFVFEDFAHFDTTVYDYEWYVDGTQTPESNVQEILKSIVGRTNVRVIAIDKDVRECTWTDDLVVSTEPPLEIEAVIKDVPCSNEDNEILINILDGPPSPTATWAELPGNNSLSILDLDTGMYNLHIEDENYSANCALDTFFHIQGTAPIAIEALFLEDTYCFDDSGIAQVRMQDSTRTYRYIWDGVLNNTDSLGGLAEGGHTIRVVEPATGCEDDTVFSIASQSLDINLESTNETCSNGDGAVRVLLPEGSVVTDFGIVINGVQQNVIEYPNLSSGNYTVRVFDKDNTGCEDMESIQVGNIERDIPLQNIITTPSNCGSGTGSASFIMANNGITYLFSWQTNDFDDKNTYQNLNVGTYNMTIKEEGTLCEIDTVIDIPGQGFTYDAITQDEFCDNNNGLINIMVDDPNVNISWNDGSNSFDRTSLSEGRYDFVLTNPLDPTCQTSGFYILEDDESDVTADFTFRSLVGGDEIGVGDIVKFNERAQGAIEFFEWDFNDGDQSKDANPEHMFDEERMYNVTLTVTDIYGCQADVTKPIITIKRAPCGAVLPNAFSPNGDNMNDDIGMLGIAYNVDLRIYNRWGELVFRGYHDEDRWDGVYRGESSPIGAYPYVLEYTCPDNRGKMIKEKKVGDISLVR